MWMGMVNTKCIQHYGNALFLKLDAAGTVGRICAKQDCQFTQIVGKKDGPKIIL